MTEYRELSHTELQRKVDLHSDDSPQLLATPPPICIGGIAPVAGAPVAGGAAENPPDPISPPPHVGGAPYPPIAGAPALIPGAPIATGGAPTPPPTIGGAPPVIVGGARAPPVRDRRAMSRVSREVSMDDSIARDDDSTV